MNSCIFFFHFRGIENIHGKNKTKQKSMLISLFFELIFQFSKINQNDKGLSWIRRRTARFQAVEEVFVLKGSPTTLYTYRSSFQLHLIPALKFPKMEDVYLPMARPNNKMAAVFMLAVTLTLWTGTVSPAPRNIYPAPTILTPLLARTSAAHGTF